MNTPAPTFGPTASSQPTNDPIRIICGFERVSRNSTGDFTDTPGYPCGNADDPLIINYNDEPEGRIFVNSGFRYEVAVRIPNQIA